MSRAWARHAAPAEVRGASRRAGAGRAAAWAACGAGAPLSEGAGTGWSAAPTPTRREQRKESQMAEQIMLNPKETTATYRVGSLTIRASGEEDGVQNIRIIEENAEVSPPIFAVVGDPSPKIGMFPYTAEGQFEIGREVASIVLATPAGERQIPVRPSPDTQA
jgi:hypothetical protein